MSLNSPDEAVGAGFGMLSRCPDDGALLAAVQRLARGRQEAQCRMGRTPEKDGRPSPVASREAIRADHATAARSRAMVRNSSVRAALTAAAASRSLTDRAKASSSAKETPGLRCCAASSSDLSFS